TAIGMALSGNVNPAARLVYISGEPDTPGHVYRVERAAAAAAAVGANVIWMRVEEVSARLGDIDGATALILWRVAWNEEIEVAVATARRGGTRVVFDIDDLMIDPELARTDVIDGIRSQNLTERVVRDLYARVRN